jgi:hypothetical protein
MYLPCYLMYQSEGADKRCYSTPFDVVYNCFWTMNIRVTRYTWDEQNKKIDKEFHCEYETSFRKFIVCRLRRAHCQLQIP